MKTNKKNIIEKVNNAFSQNKPEDFLSLCSENISWRMVGDKTVTGKDEVRKWMATGMGNVGMSPEPPIFDITKIIEEDNYATAFGEMKQKKMNSDVVKFSFCDI